jgi:steroid delta-isomerase-like uncharacterized protein
MEGEAPLSLSAWLSWILSQREPSMPDIDIARHRAVIARFYEAFSTGRGAIFDEILASDWQDHPAAEGQAPGPQGLKSVMAAYREAFRGLIITPQVVVVEGDHAVARSRLEGVHARDWAGYAASGKPVAFNCMEMHRFRDGLIAETWHFEDYSPLGRRG